MTMTMQGADNILRDFIAKNRGRMTFVEHEVKGLLKEMGLSVPDGVFIAKGKPLSAFSLQVSALSYPLVAKVSSSKITSKSDVNGVKLGIRDEGELRDVVSGLMEIEHAEGVLVEEMAPDGIEVIVGGLIDEQFGPIVMFGLGGMFVEIFRDVAFGLAPLTSDGALGLIRQIKGYRLLEGYRGRKPADIDALIDIIVTVSGLMATGLIGEIDLNPVALFPEGAMVLDAKMTVAVHKVV
jgi:acyl-CoA synthetase (NDP forming)